MTEKEKDWRRRLPVLVSDAQERMSVAVIRSLGRAGYPVIACSAQADAVGFQSRFASEGIPCPPYGCGEFVPWLRDCILRYGIRCVVPGEELLLELRPYFEEFAPLLPMSSSADVVYRGISKFDLFEHLADTPNLPPLIAGDETTEPPTTDEFAALGMPVFLKGDGRHRLSGLDSEVIKARTPENAVAQLAGMRQRFSRWLVQGLAPGQGVGAFVLRWDDKVLAEMMHLRLHEIPLQGWSSYRKCWWHEAIMADARAKLAALDWQGVAMMEYRWDPGSDSFRLIEMNGRFWGSLHLALYAGVDFPALLVDAFHGRVGPAVSGRHADVRSRNTVLEARYVWSALTDKSRPFGKRLWSVPEFFLLMLNPKVKSDMFFPGDRRLFWRQLASILARPFRRRRRRA